MISEQIVPAINESTTQLLRAINRFSSRSFNETPPNGDWSAGQVAEHILLTDIFISRILQILVTRIDCERQLFLRKVSKHFRARASEQWANNPTISH